jgi:hypothetical protein
MKVPCLKRSIQRRGFTVDAGSGTAAVKMRQLYATHIMRLGAALMLAFVASALITPALAGITVKSARYAAGVLDLRGETGKPGQRVSLDNRYVERSDSHGRFHFRIQYLPHDCTVDLNSGGTRRVAFIEGCLPD